MPPAVNAAEDQLIVIARIPFPLFLFPIDNGKILISIGFGLRCGRLCATPEEVSDFLSEHR